MAVPNPAITLLASGSYSSSMSGLGSPVSVAYPAAAIFQVNVTNAPSSASFSTATLDVQLLHTLDGTNYDSFLRFPQIGNGTSAVARQLGSWNGMVAASTSTNFHAGSTSTLAVSSVLNGPLGWSWKVAYTIVNGPSAPSSSCYSFSVLASVLRQS